MGSIVFSVWNRGMLEHIAFMSIQPKFSLVPRGLYTIVGKCPLGLGFLPSLGAHFDKPDRTGQCRNTTNSEIEPYTEKSFVEIDFKL